ncbi:50S ribosomal protein L25 [Candidatus Hodgkinia cicadicola]|uniref:50S ribosomal protein L25 n=1 Tax=Candidatus Hodgkinia cicadicola TaxID=573658 RepID=A0ABX4MIW7_9HYPH|nr:50S ribosomal protein L25 [Candidatus Hodgkinia cicadicola]
MDCFKLLKRSVIGRNSCCKIRNNNFIPGIIRTVDNYIMPIFVGNGIIKRLAYKQVLIVMINGIIMKVLLKNYQICNKTREVQNLEYHQISYKLSKVLIPFIYIKKDKAIKSNTKLLKPLPKLIAISNAYLIPNYIKVIFSDFQTKNKITFNTLNYKGMITLSTKQTISTIE